jgi:hypothetical protein
MEVSYTGCGQARLKDNIRNPGQVATHLLTSSPAKAAYWAVPTHPLIIDIKEVLIQRNSKLAAL